MDRRLLVLPVIAAVSASAIAAMGASPAPRPKVGSCRAFPGNNPWNQRVDKLPVARNSDTIVRSIGPEKGMHADFGPGKTGGGPIGTRNTTAGAGQHKVHVSFDYASESDRGPCPIPP